MAALSILSNERDFSRIIFKNPESGMSVKNVKYGKMFGYYSGSNRYNVVFFDGMDEISYVRYASQDFEFLDRTRYNSPLFITSALTTYFSSALNNPNEFDHPGEYTFFVNAVDISNIKLFNNIIKYFEDYEIIISPIKHSLDTSNSYMLKATSHTHSLQELLSLMYLLAFFIIQIDDIHLNISRDNIIKLVKACNLLQAPYYIKYLIKKHAIHKLDDFNAIKKDLDYNAHHRFDFRPYTNNGARYEEVVRQLLEDKDIVDIGCGDGAYLKLSNKIKGHYYAIDKEQTCRDMIAKKRERYGLTNVSIMESLTCFLQIQHEEYIALLAEVIEHNSKEDVKNMLMSLYNDPLCRKVVITTPNYDFNRFYLLSGLRHPDHVFEFSKQEAIAFFTQLPWKFTCQHLGDEVDQIPTTLLVLLTKE